MLTLAIARMEQEENNASEERRWCSADWGK